jgi:hypothetical protein
MTLNSTSFGMRPSAVVCLSTASCRHYVSGATLHEMLLLLLLLLSGLRSGVAHT